jgi:D-3-phosphoglycerate dehydrogenase
MPKGACLINTARKEVINEQELEEILLARTDLNYAADVAPSNIDALTAQFHTRVYATPKKMGAETAEANINAGLAAARQIVGFFKQGDRKLPAEQYKQHFALWLRSSPSPRCGPQKNL